MELTLESQGYLESLYRAYLEDPLSLPEDWRRYFSALTLEDLEDGRRERQAAPLPGEALDLGFLLKVEALRQAYRELGHLAARIDPLGRERPRPKALSLEAHGLSPEDLRRPLPPLFGAPTLGALLERLEATYLGPVGFEVAHVEPEERAWLLSRIEAPWPKPAPEVRRRVLRSLLQASLFEAFLQRKYLGAKTFSVEGLESLIPLLQEAVQEAARFGVREVVLGMAHRGRLNVLAHVVEKPFEAIFREFEELFPEGYVGDVKYHLGHSTDVETPFGPVHVSLNFNPSHLEFVNPVTLGRVRAKQDRFGDRERKRGLAILVHGDAAFIGEGIVQETLNLSGLPGYRVGGTLHVVANNQLGFTTLPSEYASGRYPTDVAKMVGAPIFHVNAEALDELLFVLALALEYRSRYGKDVVIDLVGYRRRGHNETDEPTFTQAPMYALIAKKPEPWRVYAERLKAEGLVSEEELKAWQEAYLERLESEFARVKAEATPVVYSTLGGVWQGYVGGPDRLVPEADTAFPKEGLKNLLMRLSAVPEGFQVHPKLKRFLEARLEMAEEKRPVDWATAEALAFATLAVEGHRVRLTGQDALRGTFTQRHAALYDYRTGERYIPLQHLAEGQAEVEIWNSPLSEAGVLGFEYGYSLDYPEGLVLWEAQFGDFVNVAQVYIDQFLASAEVKWNRLSGLVLLLPHGLEGQGPEHSSARLERFLQLGAKDNLQVAYPTTPAQFFHLLRRQVKRPIRKPLVVMTPKSLLRHPEVVSTLEELAEGRFQKVIPERVKGARKVLLTSGKVYYDLLQKRRELQAEDVAILRLELLYPFPEAELQEALGFYPKKVPVVFVQEEPVNQGAWWYLSARFCGEIYGHPFSVVARPESPSPAVGSSKVHRLEQEELLEEAFR
ncbi:2-oxoglutarate dehydrogenase, E1 component [Thermus thermophilus]|uniref:2-oxoglutarate dehydrogenase E1 component n=1 Tax=Thermus thermophilus TaxID=274 RepID=UPI00090B42FF|nr:2-oxoglutarate dehydrogenase E1 component [Thermus thermophilus]BAW02160.1 2-oxoglutarate dehydrogenase, E1 component [Thermus thermophilus]BDB10416.1 2-oxoglutarate dehydrogenase subunit E1 [Thermus thermophilus]